MSVLLQSRYILLADDDKDDIALFSDILEELKITTIFTVVNDGTQLMDLLLNTNTLLPDILFLDLNMPGKNGQVCLLEIKKNEKLNHFPVIVYSTSNDTTIINLLYKNGAQYYFRKPNEYNQFKNLIEKALILTVQKDLPQPHPEQFILSDN